MNATLVAAEATVVETEEAKKVEEQALVDLSVIELALVGGGSGSPLFQ